MKSKIYTTAMLPIIVLSVIFLVLPATAQVNLQQGLVAYYPFNGNANDESGNGNHGTLMNQTYFNNGLTGECVNIVGACQFSYHCTGSSGGHILIPYVDFNSMSSFTICIWVNEAGMVYSHGESYISFGNHSQHCITIAHFHSNLYFKIGNKSFATPFDLSAIDNWHFYTLVYDIGTLKAYSNSELIGQVSGVTLNLTSYYSALGRHWWNDGILRTSTRMNGAFDELRIYNRALNEQEIYTLYTLGQPPQTNTISNILINQRNDGSGLVDVYFGLYGTGSQYNITIEASFDGGNTYTAISTSFLSGDVSNISPGTNKHLVWDGLGSFPNTYSTSAKLKIIANPN